MIVNTETADDGVPTPDILMRQFSSLGDNCEFGLVQRLCGAEPMDLLRLSWSDLDQVIRAIGSGFADVGALENVKVEWKEDEFFVTETSYKFAYHTFINDSALDPSSVQSDQSRHLRRLARKCLEDIQSGERIFVRKGNDSTDEAQLLRLHDALQRHGRSWLLWVVQADEDHLGGTVEVQQPGLLKARIESFAPYHDAHDFNLMAWVEICCRAFIAVRQVET